MTEPCRSLHATTGPVRPRGACERMARRPRRRRGAAVLFTVVLGVSVTACRPPPTIVYTYVVRGWDHASGLEAFAADAAQTLGDDRGWNLGGRIAFRRVASGGHFTLWLSAPAHLPSFSPVCTADWSCSVGPDVVINNRNWSNGTPAWNNAGGSLRNYRHMVVNHEVGHWLGFGHAPCSGPGQLAPVTQQQSMGLQGCASNPWPRADERQRAAAARGLR